MGISMVDEFEHHEEENKIHHQQQQQIQDEVIHQEEIVEETTEKQPSSTEEQSEVVEQPTKKKENLGSKIINTIVGVVDSLLGTEKENNSTNSLNETHVNKTSLEDGENSDDNATVEHFPTNETSPHS